MDRNRTGAFGHLVEELKKVQFKGYPLIFGTIKSRYGDTIDIYFKSQPAFYSLHPKYKAKLEGRITIEIEDECYSINCESPNCNLLTAIEEVRSEYLSAKRNNREVEPFGTTAYGYAIQQTYKTFQKAETVLMWVNKLLNTSYDNIVEGMAWYKSAPVMADVKAYIDYVDRRNKLVEQRDAIQKEIDQAYSQFMAYNGKYKENFKRVRKAKTDF